MKARTRVQRQAALRHYRGDAGVRDPVVRQHDLQPAGFEVVAHVPGRVQRDTKSCEHGVADYLAHVALERARTRTAIILYFRTKK
jgi:hypothetical protein